LGLLLVVLAIFTSSIFKLEPVFFALIILLYAFVAGRIINVFGAKLVRTPPPLALPKISDEEMREVLTRRGYGNLVDKSKRRRKIVRK
jgi:hypothetical protein